MTKKAKNFFFFAKGYVELETYLLNSWIQINICQVCIEITTCRTDTENIEDTDSALT